MSLPSISKRRAKPAPETEIMMPAPEVLPGIIVNHQIADFYDILSKVINLRFERRFNKIKGQLEIRHKSAEYWRDLDDRTFADIVLEITMLTIQVPKGFSLNSGILERILKSSKYTDEFHPLENYLSGLVWDGRDHIKALAETLSVSTSKDYYIRDKSLVEFWPVMLRRWLINSAAIASGAGGAAAHAMLILVGGQGKGKTTWLENLCPDEMKEFSHCGHIDPGSKDSCDMLAEKWFVNIDDQLNNILRQDFNNIKALITLPSVSNRKAYDRSVKKRARIASFMASVNSTEIFTDTENRRYLCFPLDDKKKNPINFKAMQEIDINQVWAQSMAAVRAKEQYYFTADEMDFINSLNQLFSQARPEEELLSRNYAPAERTMPGANALQASEILTELIRRSGQKLSLHWLIHALNKLGFKVIQERRPEYNNQVRKVYYVNELSNQPKQTYYSSF